MAKGPARRRAWIDLLLLLVTLGALAGVTQEAMRSAEIKADLAVVSREARRLHAAFVRFHEQNGRFPGLRGEARLDRATLDPLRARGYYEGPIAARLAERSVDAYVSGDGKGSNDEFWVEMSLASDPSIRFLVARSDDAPLGGGQWREGAYVLRNGVLEPL